MLAKTKCSTGTRLTVTKMGCKATTGDRFEGKPYPSAQLLPSFLPRPESTRWLETELTLWGNYWQKVEMMEHLLTHRFRPFSQKALGHSLGARYPSAVTARWLRVIFKNYSVGPPRPSPRDTWSGIHPVVSSAGINNGGSGFVLPSYPAGRKGDISSHPSVDI